MVVGWIPLGGICMFIFLLWQDGVEFHHSSISGGKSKKECLNSSYSLSSLLMYDVKQYPIPKMYFHIQLLLYNLCKECPQL